MSKKYFGYSELNEAYELSLDNANQLYQDASILFDNSSFSHAYALFQLSREESGKCLLIQHAMLYSALGIKVDYRWLTRMGFVDHVSKTRNSLGLENLIISFVERMEFVELLKLHEDIEGTAMNIKQTDKLKNSSLYVGFNRSKFVSPSQVISKEMVREIELSANVCIWAAKAIRLTEGALAKMVDYLRNSIDRERTELIDRLKAILCNVFEKKEAMKYCDQIDSILLHS